MLEKLIEQYPDSGGGQSQFETYDEAAEVIAGYWQGDVPEELLRSIQGLGDPEIYKQAIRFAEEATAEDPEAKGKLKAAINFLWKDYEAGSGAHLLVEAEEAFSTIKEIRELLEADPGAVSTRDLVVIAQRDINPGVRAMAAAELGRRAEVSG